jgi:hypothetical protein
MTLRQRSGLRRRAAPDVDSLEFSVTHSNAPSSCVMAFRMIPMRLIATPKRKARSGHGQESQGKPVTCGHKKGPLVAGRIVKAQF